MANQNPFTPQACVASRSDLVQIYPSGLFHELQSQLPFVLIVAILNVLRKVQIVLLLGV